MDHRRSSMTLTFRNMEASNALCRANSHLSARQPDVALRAYTEILSDIAPGHPCAFLNRSLCYLCLGYPELAASDALRALLATSVARLAGGQHSAQGKQIMSFWNATLLSQQRGELWAMRPTCYVNTGLVELLDGDLACLYIRLRVPRRPGFTKAEAIFHDVRMKAWYRLAYALWKCGGGATKSAIDILEDASPAAWHEDHKAFDALANRILEDVETALTTVSIRKLSSQKTRQTNDTGRVSESIPAREDLLRLLETRFTFIPRPSYPWDRHSLHLSTQSQVEQITKAFASVLSCCEVKRPERDGKTDELCFIAKKDIYSTEPIFKETSAFYVSTSRPTIGDDMLFCEACAAKLTVPKSLLVRLVSDSRPVSPMSACSKTEPNTRRSSFSSVKVEMDHNEHKTSPSKEDAQKSTRDGQLTDTAASTVGSPRATLPALPLTPPSENKPLYSPEMPEIPEDAFMDLQFCPCCRKVVFCSSDCFEAAAEHYHADVCDKDMEGCLGSDKNAGDSFTGLPHAKVRKLQALMLGRLFAKADGRECSPLELEEIWVLGYSLGSRDRRKTDTLTGKQSAGSVSYDAADFSTATALDEESSRAELRSNRPVSMDNGVVLPWSFKNDVFLPLQLLLELGGTDLALDVKRYDGWVINTIRSEIQKHMRVTKRPRCEKTYSERGFLTETLFFEDTENDDQDPKPKNDESSWVGSLHPMLSLINVATSKDDANVSIRDFSGTILCTAKAANFNSPASDRDEETMQDVAYQRDPLSAQSSEPSSQPGEVPAIKAGQVLYRPPEPVPHLTPSPDEQKLLERIMALLPYKGGKQTLTRHGGSGYPIDELVPRPLFSGLGGLRNSGLGGGQTQGHPAFVGPRDLNSAPNSSADENRRPQTENEKAAQSMDIDRTVTDDEIMLDDDMDGGVSVSDVEVEHLEFDRGEHDTPSSRDDPSGDTLEEGEINDEGASRVDEASARLVDAMRDTFKRSAA